MPIDRELLRQLKAKPAAKQTGVGALPRGIHKTPGLREWVTLESVALPPVPFIQEGQWRLISLLVVPTQLEDGSKGWFAPWGAVEWSWQEQQVLQKIDLRSREDTASLRHAKTISAHPTLDPRSRTRRENALFRALDELLANPNSDRASLSTLVGHYAGLLPEAIYPYYHNLIPESREWLHPQTAPVLPSSPNAEKQDSVDISQKQAEQQTSTEEYPIEKPRLESPADLSDRIGSWLRKSLALAESLSLEDVDVKTQLIGSLKALDARRKLPGFRLAIVGEFSRGKSSLINTLLNRELLPVGAPPTTATLTSIVAGSQERMQVSFDKDRKEVRSLAASSWDDLLATDFVGSDQEVFASVRITLDDSWLRSLDVELIDTPGAGDLNGHRAAIVFDLLSQCDAAVLVVSATLPFSMTEAAFLEQQVIGRHVPRILVVVSKLDTIDQEEREPVLIALRERVAKISAAIPVLPSYPVNNSTQAEAQQALQNEIAAMVAKGERACWRSRQVAGQLVDYLNQLVKIGEAAIAAEKMSAAEREQALRQAQAQLQNAELDWENLRLQLERRRLQREQNLRQRIFSFKTELLELLSMELSRTPQPKTWWERDLPFRMRRELVTLSRKFEDFLLKAIAEDFDWLQREISRTFATKVAGAAPSLEVSEILPNLRQLNLTNTQKYRILTRIGSSAATVCGYFLGGPIGIVLSTSVWLVGEQIVGKEVEAQRQMLSQELERSVDRTFDEYCTCVGDRLRQLYNKLAEDTKRQQTAWQSARNAALETSNSGSDEKEWQQLIDQALELNKEILAAMNA